MKKKSAPKKAAPKKITRTILNPKAEVNFPGATHVEIPIEEYRQLQYIASEAARIKSEPVQDNDTVKNTVKSTAMQRMIGHYASNLSVLRSSLERIRTHLGRVAGGDPKGELPIASAGTCELETLGSLNYNFSALLDDYLEPAVKALEEIA